MLEVLSVLSLAGAFFLLISLSVIDLRHGLLPNELVLGFLALGVVFHLSTVFTLLSLTDMFLGAFIGGGFLYLLREISKYFYDEDALGLGDVKLLAAAGFWLGPYYILIALTLGGLAGILHGLGLLTYLRMKTKNWIDLNYLSVPAGPGFTVGILFAAGYAFWNMPALPS